MSMKPTYAQGDTRSLRLTRPRRRPPHLHHPPHELSPGSHPLAADSSLRQSLSQVRFLSLQLQMKVLDEMRPRGLSNATAVSAWSGRRRSPVRWHHHQPVWCDWARLFLFEQEVPHQTPLLKYSKPISIVNREEE